MKRSLEAAGFGLLAAGAVLARRYRRDLVVARRRLAELDSRTVETSAGAVEYLRMGRGSSAAARTRRRGRLRCAAFLAGAHPERVSNHRTLALRLPGRGHATRSIRRCASGRGCCASGRAWCRESKCAWFLGRKLLVRATRASPSGPRCGSGAGIGERTACEAGAARAANPGPDPVLATDSLVVARLRAKPAGTIAGAPPTIPERGRPAHARRTRARGQWSRVSLARTGSQSSVAATSSSTTISTRSLRSPRSSPRPRHQWPM